MGEEEKAAIEELKALGLSDSDIATALEERVKEREQESPGFLSSLKKAGGLLVGAEQPSDPEDVGFIRSFVEQITRDLPVVAGALKGGAIGTVAAPGPGTIAGAIFGGASVRALQTGVQRATEGLPKGQTPAETVLKDTAGALEAGALEAITGGIPGKAAGAEVKRLATEGQRVLAEEFAKVGGKLSASQVTDNGVVRFLEGIARSGFSGAGVFEEFSKQQAKSITKLQERTALAFATKAASTLKEEELGGLVKRTLRNGKEAFTATGSALYKKLSDLPDAPEVDITELQSLAKSQLEKFKEIQNIGKSKQSKGLLDGLAKLGVVKREKGAGEEVAKTLFDARGLPLVKEALPDTIGTGRLSFEAAQDLRSNLLDVARDLAEVKGDAKARRLVQNTITKLTVAMEAAGKSAGGDAGRLWSQANAFWKSGSEVFNNKLVANLILEDKIAASVVGQNLLKADNLENVKLIRRALRKSLTLQKRGRDFDPVWKNVQAGFFSNVIADASTDGVLSGKKLISKLTDRRVTKTLNASFTTKQINAMRTFARVVETTQKKPPASVLIQLIQGGAVFKAASGDVTQALAILATPLGLAKAMTNPKLVNMLTRGLRLPSGTKEAATLTKQIVKEVARVFTEEKSDPGGKVDRLLQENPAPQLGAL